MDDFSGSPAHLADAVRSLAKSCQAEGPQVKVKQEEGMPLPIFSSFTVLQGSVQLVLEPNFGWAAL